MMPVYNKFRKNKSVQFLSINIDNSEKWWKIGLESGKYSIPGSIHLSLCPLGKNHPLLKFYNYYEFPQLLIIDKKGQTTSVYPPDPRIDNGEKLIELLAALLTEEYSNGRILRLIIRPFNLLRINGFGRAWISCN